MKILFLQISDIHCKAGDQNLRQKILKIAPALKEIDHFDKIVFIFSGDLADKANENEYKVARLLIGELITTLSESFNCGFINTLIVPGNHDIKLSDGCRTCNDILKFNKAEKIESEIKLMDNFFKYSTSKKCFLKNKIVDVHNVEFDNKKFRICLLNSAPFSTKSPDDKELHFLPDYVSESLIRDNDVDFQITVIHHSYECFDWNSKEMLKNHLWANDLVLFGHDHKAESFTQNNYNGSKLNVIIGGEFALNTEEPASFNAIVVDTEDMEFTQNEFEWNKNKCIFKIKKQVKFKKYKTDLQPSEKYINSLLEDKQKISNLFTDYYVFPKLIVKGELFSDDYIDNIDANKIFELLMKEKIIKITGNASVGKSALLKYLYLEAIKCKYVPLLIEKKNYNENKIDKIIKKMFKLQYDGVDYSLYEQGNRDGQIIFIDDIDLIEDSRTRQHLIEYILDSKRLLICSSKENWQDLEDIVKEKLKGKTISSFEVPYFLKENRDKLVNNICSIYKKTDDDKLVICSSLDYMAQCQSGLLSLVPATIIQYIKFFLSNDNSDNTGIKAISLVYETNIKSSIIKSVSSENASIYLSVLEFLASSMYFKYKKEYINTTELENIIDEFNKLRKAKINAKKFCDVCKSTDLLRECEDSFCVHFSDKNTFAYFIAKSINKEIEKDPANQEHLKYVMNYICFGINDTIILFLSYIRNNTNVILNIAKTAADLLENFPELDFDKNNVPFVKQSLNVPNAVPSKKEKKEATNNIEEIERARQNNIKFKGIFDFNESDVNKERYKILRALKYTRLIGRILVEQYGELEAEEVDIIIKYLYSLPQKIIFALLNPYQEHYKEISDSLMEYASNTSPNEKITEDDIREALGLAGALLTLNLMNDIAYNSTNKLTMDALRDVQTSNSNYSIMKLMFEENLGKNSNFVSNAIELFKKYESDPFVRMLISQIARKHIIYNFDINHSQVERLISAGILSNKGKPLLLLEQRNKKKG